MPNMPEGLKSVGTIVGCGQVKDMWNNKKVTLMVLAVIAILVGGGNLVWNHGLSNHAKDFLVKLWNEGKVKLDNPAFNLSLTVKQLVGIVGGTVGGVIWLSWGGNAEGRRYLAQQTVRNRATNKGDVAGYKNNKINIIDLTLED